MADETIVDMAKKDEKKMAGMSTGMKWALGIAAGVVVVGGVVVAMKMTKKDDAATTPAPGSTTPPSPSTTVIEPEYSIAPALALHLDALPVLRPQMGSAAGQTFWVLGDDLATSVGTYLSAAGLSTGNTSVAPASSDPTTSFVSDFSAQVANHGKDGLADADVWFITLGPKQTKADVAALTQSIQQLRAKLPNQRILWVLAKSAPAEIAKALNESHEEWVRSAADDATMANDAWKAATAGDLTAINTAFPAPPAVGA